MQLDRAWPKEKWSPSRLGLENGVGSSDQGGKSLGLSTSRDFVITEAERRPEGHLSASDSRHGDDSSVRSLPDGIVAWLENQSSASVNDGLTSGTNSQAGPPSEKGTSEVLGVNVYGKAGVGSCDSSESGVISHKDLQDNSGLVYPSVRKADENLVVKAPVTTSKPCPCCSPVNIRLLPRRV